MVAILLSRGGVENTRLQAKAKDTKKIRGQGQGQPFRGQTLGQGQECSRPRPRTKDTNASALQKKKKRSSRKGLHKNFSSDPHEKTFSKNFSSAPQNFNNSKHTAVLEPRTGQFLRTWGLEAKAKDFKICPRGLHLCCCQLALIFCPKLNDFDILQKDSVFLLFWGDVMFQKKYFEYTKMRGTSSR